MKRLVPLFLFLFAVSALAQIPPPRRRASVPPQPRVSDASPCPGVTAAERDAVDCVFDFYLSRLSIVPDLRGPISVQATWLDSASENQTTEADFPGCPEILPAGTSCSYTAAHVEVVIPRYNGSQSAPFVVPGQARKFRVKVFRGAGTMPLLWQREYEWTMPR